MENILRAENLIGRGTFTKCYHEEGSESVYLVSCDPIKECMAHGWFPSSENFPKIELLTEGVYKMEYYPKTPALKKHLEADQWAIYQELRHLFLNSNLPTNEDEYFFYWHKQFDTITNEEARETLKEALDACGNYGTDICFEISPRNVAAKEGKLILLDCFFSTKTLMKVRGL